VDTCQDSMQVLGRLGQQVQLVLPPDAPLVPPGGVTSRVYGGGGGQTGQVEQAGQGGQQVRLAFPPDASAVPPEGLTGRVYRGGGVVDGEEGQGVGGQQLQRVCTPDVPQVSSGGLTTNRVYGGGGVAGGHVGQGGEGREGGEGEQGWERGEGGQGGERGERWEGGQGKGADAAADAAAAPPAAAASAAAAAAVAAATTAEGRDAIGSNGWKIGNDAGLRLIEEEAGGWVDVIVPEQSGGVIEGEVDYNKGWTWMEVESGREKHVGYSHLQKGEGCPSSNRWSGEGAKTGGSSSNTSGQSHTHPHPLYSHLDSNRWSREGAKTAGGSNTSGQFHAHLHPPYSHLDSNRSSREGAKTGGRSRSGAHQSHHATWLEDISRQLVPDHVSLVPPSSLQNTPSCCSSSSSLPSATHRAPSSSPSPSSPSHSSPSPSSPLPSTPFTSRPGHKPSSLPASYPPSEARILLRNCSLVCRLSSGRHILSSSAAIISGLCAGLCAAPGATAGAGAGSGGTESAQVAAESAQGAAESAARLRLEGPCMEVILRGVDVQIDKFQPDRLQPDRLQPDRLQPDRLQPDRLQVPLAAGVDDNADAAGAADGIASAAADAAATAAECAQGNSHTSPPHGGKRESVYASRVAVTVREIGVWDRGLQQGQQGQQGLGQGQNGQGQQQGGRRWARVGGAYGREAADVRSKALRLLLDAVRPNPTVEIDEFRLSVALLPIRLCIDQNHIEFLSRFFTTPIPPPTGDVTGNHGAATTTSVATAGAATANLGASEAPAAATAAAVADAELLRDALLPFFQVCEIRAFSILIDYVPHRLDLSALSAGNYAHLLNLISWKGVEIDFTKARVVGVQGWDGLGGALISQWAEDICRRQLHRVVKAAGPVSPLWALGAASIQLVLLPVQEYRQNKRLMRGVKRGAIFFLQSLSHELLGVGVTVAAGTHHLLHAAELALAATASATNAGTNATAGPAAPATSAAGVTAATASNRPPSTNPLSSSSTPSAPCTFSSSSCSSSSRSFSFYSSSTSSPSARASSSRRDKTPCDWRELGEHGSFEEGSHWVTVFADSGSGSSGGSGSSSSGDGGGCGSSSGIGGGFGSGIGSGSGRSSVGALAAAQEVLNRSVERSLSSLLGAPLRKWRRGDGMPAVAAAVVKGIPAAAMAPVVGAAEALEETLRGVKRTIAPRK
ncbi:unnamed protein product, partial [Closterium sp. NIES-54]